MTVPLGWQGSPSNMILPEDVDSRPAIMRSSVVLPARIPGHAQVTSCSEALAVNWAKHCTYTGTHQPFAACEVELTSRDWHLRLAQHEQALAS